MIDGNREQVKKALMDKKVLAVRLIDSTSDVMFTAAWNEELKVGGVTKRDILEESAAHRDLENLLDTMKGVSRFCYWQAFDYETTAQQLNAARYELPKHYWADCACPKCGEQLMSVITDNGDGTVTCQCGEKYIPGEAFAKQQEFESLVYCCMKIVLDPDNYAEGVEAFKTEVKKSPSEWFTENKEKIVEFFLAQLKDREELAARGRGKQADPIETFIKLLSGSIAVPPEEQ